MVRTEHANPIRKRALVVDDQPLFRAGVRQLLLDELDVGVIEARDATSALAAVDREQVDIVIMELAIGREMGFSLISTLRASRPYMPILVLSMHDEDVFAERSVASGANGYVGKREAADVIVRAIRRVLEGKIHVSSKVNDRLLESLSTPRSSKHPKGNTPFRLLTERELEVFRRLGMALSSAQIARELGISVKTVETHCCNMKEKLGAGSNRELVVLAVHWLRDGFLECGAPRRRG